MSIDETLRDEEALMGGVLCKPETIYQAAEHVDSKSFLSSGFGLVFQSIQVMLQTGTPITRANVAIELTRIQAVEAIGGVKRLVELLDSGLPHHVQYYAEQVAKHCRRRRLRAFIDDMRARAEDSTCDPLEVASEMGQAIGMMGGEDASQKQISQVVIEFLEQCEKTKAAGKESVMPTGLGPLDTALDGGLPAGMVAVGARPSIGKSAFGSEICYRVAKRNEPTLFVSLEMNFRQVASRFVLRSSSMHASDLNRLTYTQDQIDQAFSTALQDASVPMEFWHKPGATIAKIEARIRSDIAKRGCRLVVIDYIQLIKASGFSEPRHRVSHVSNEIARMSKELNIPILILAQVGRQSEGSMPTVADLKESGSIEEDSDIVILLHREKRDSEDLIANVAKQRNGEIAQASLLMKRGVVMPPAEAGAEFHSDFR